MMEPLSLMHGTGNSSSLLQSLIAITAVIVFACFLFSQKLNRSVLWQAMVTPVASIVGSGFLVSAPLLMMSVGRWAPVVMAVIVGIAYLLGEVMRNNILHLEPKLTQKSNHALSTVRIEQLSKPFLAIAYVISVGFYLKLLASFIIYSFGFHSVVAENLLTTIILLFIAGANWLVGINSLERLERVSVSSKIAIILAMILVHLVFNFELLARNEWFVFDHHHYSKYESLQRLLGLLVIIQGFETSRYLGGLYSAPMRMKSMRYAQIFSGAIYVLFVTVSMPLFNEVHVVTETTVIDLCRMIAPVLPVLLVAAAVMSQFSASIADTLGSAGIIEEASSGRIKGRTSVLLVISFAILLTWTTNIFEIITLASKAFAIYYALQCLISAIICQNSNRQALALGALLLTALMACIVLFGTPVKA